MAEGAGLAQKAKDYFGLSLDRVRTVSVLTVDADLTGEQREQIRTEIFTNPVTQVSAYTPLPVDFDWCIWVGYRPGVRDNPGATATEALEDLLGIRFGEDDSIYTSKRYCISGANLTESDMDRIAGELIANDIIQQWKIFSRQDWDPNEGIGLILPKVRLDHTPTVSVVSIDSDETLRRISDERNLALNPADIPTIRSYFLRSPERPAAARPLRSHRCGAGIHLPGPERSLQSQHLPGAVSLS